MCSSCPTGPSGALRRTPYPPAHPGTGTSCCPQGPGNRRRRHHHRCHHRHYRRPGTWPRGGQGCQRAWTWSGGEGQARVRTQAPCSCCLPYYPRDQRHHHHYRWSQAQAELSLALARGLWSCLLRRTTAGDHEKVAVPTQATRARAPPLAPGCGTWTGGPLGNGDETFWSHVGQGSESTAPWDSSGPSHPACPQRCLAVLVQHPQQHRIPRTQALPRCQRPLHRHQGCRHRHH